MGKIKIYELAKELNVDNKELLETAHKLGITAKSHLSSIEEDEAMKIKNNFKSKSVKKEELKVKENKKIVNKDEKQSKNKADAKEIKVEKNDIKTTGQVIIRREVVMTEEKKETNIKEQKTGIGFDTTQRRNRDFNIVYREKPTKPMTVNELFGIKPKKEENKKEPIIKEEPVVSEPITQAKQEKKEEQEIVVKKETQTTNVDDTLSANKVNKSTNNRSNNEFYNPNNHRSMGNVSHSREGGFNREGNFNKDSNFNRDNNFRGNQFNRNQERSSFSRDNGRSTSNGFR